jgi:hypothetical protein
MVSNYRIVADRDQPLLITDAKLLSTVYLLASFCQLRGNEQKRHNIKACRNSFYPNRMTLWNRNLANTVDEKLFHSQSPVALLFKKSWRTLQGKDTVKKQ